MVYVFGHPVNSSINYWWINWRSNITSYQFVIGSNDLLAVYVDRLEQTWRLHENPKPITRIVHHYIVHRTPYYCTFEPSSNKRHIQKRSSVTEQQSAAVKISPFYWLLHQTQPPCTVVLSCGRKFSSLEKILAGVVASKFRPSRIFPAAAAAEFGGAQRSTISEISCRDAAGKYPAGEDPLSFKKWPSH